ncbi:MAG: hypothetical protein KatS3mg003_1006 [Candidatus Nitrosocaldaceae archaeon]|nr:MAG: hypothetical protein KatS3mg003_1006 [Candidatus Nitrosocaldaceae archaeon]
MLLFSLKRKKLISVTLAIVLLVYPLAIDGAEQRVYYVSPNGNDNNDGLTPNTPFKSIMKALKLAKAGDTIILADGVYREDIDSVRDGEENNPITIKGNKDAILKAKNDDRIVEINHDYIILQGFTIDGHYKKEGKDYYTDKLIWVQGASNVRIINMTIKNAGDECIRLKYFASNNEIAYNIIRNCGVTDFKYNGGGKNGELIYIGTAPEQLHKNPTDDIDRSNNNWIHHNLFDVRGSECVDIKEGSMYNLIEYNICRSMDDEDSGGFSIRGNNNIIRYNEIYDNKGVGIRLGGDTEQDGINNDVYDNIIYNNKKGAIRFIVEPQNKICNNTIYDEKVTSGKYKDIYNPTVACN